eukprot:RCo051831
MGPPLVGWFLLLALCVALGAGVVHVRSPVGSSASVAAASAVHLEPMDELEVRVPVVPSSGYDWVPEFDSSVLRLAHTSACEFPEASSDPLPNAPVTIDDTSALVRAASPGSRIGRVCTRSLWFVGQNSSAAAAASAHPTSRPPSPSDGRVILTLRRRWETPLPKNTLATHSLRVTVGGPYAGARAFSRVVVEEAPAAAAAPARAHFAPAAIPQTYDPTTSAGFPDVRNQGSCGACWAFATVGMFEVAMAARFGRSLDLSEQYLISCNFAGYDCTSGGMFAHEYHITAVPSGEPQAGAVLESQMPYAVTVTACNPPHTHVAKINSNAVFLSSDSTTIATAIVEHGSVGITCDGDQLLAYNPSVQRIVTLSATLSTINHAIILVGYNFAASPPYWIARNQWGSSWGMNGYAQVSMSSTMPLLHAVAYTNPTGICEGGTLRSALGQISSPGTTSTSAMVTVSSGTNCTISINPSDGSPMVQLTFTAFCAPGSSALLVTPGSGSSSRLTGCSLPAVLIVNAPVGLQWITASDASFTLTYVGLRGQYSCSTPSTMPTGYALSGSSCTGTAASCQSAVTCASGYAGAAVVSCSSDGSQFSLSGCSATCLSFTTCPSNQGQVASPSSVLCFSDQCTSDQCCSAPTCTDVVVTGHPQAPVNGRYTRSGTYNGRPSYYNPTPRLYLTWFDQGQFWRNWQIGSSPSSSSAVALSMQDTSDPSLVNTGWTVYTSATGFVSSGTMAVACNGIAASPTTTTTTTSSSSTSTSSSTAATTTSSTSTTSSTTSTTSSPRSH